MIERLSDPFQPLLHVRLAAGRVLLHPGYVHPRGQQHAAECVMQAARQAGALLLLHVLQVAVQLAQLRRLRCGLGLELIVLPCQLGRRIRALARATRHGGDGERGKDKAGQERPEIQSPYDLQFPVPVGQ